MQFLTQLTLAIAALGPLARATPIDMHMESSRAPLRHFSVTQSLNPRFKAKNMLASLVKTYGKFNAAVPANVKAALATTGTVTATPEAYDSEYLCPVSIDGQTLMLDFDSGSADLWVFSSLQSASQRTGHSYFTPSSSANWHQLSGYTWRITYGDGSGARGIVGTDTVNIGGVTVTSQAVEAATSVSTHFDQDTDNDGLLGLAFSTINTVSPTKQKTFFDNAISQGLALPVFTADLRYHAAGSYDFGKIDASKYTGSITYVNVNSGNGFWEVTGSGYAVGSGSFVSASIDAIADTGTTLLLLSSSICSAYYSKVSGSSYSNTYGGYVFPCTATLPSFTVGIGTYRGVIPGTYMNYAPANNAGTTCYGSLQPDTGIGFSILGDIFFKSTFVIFDHSTPRLGLAKKA